MTISDHQFKFLKDVSLLIDYIANVEGLKVTGGWLERNEEIQKILYDKGLSNTLDSNHIKRMAIDLNIFLGYMVITNIKKFKLNDEQRDALNSIGVFWENLDVFNRWGGFFNSIYDPGHFERNV